MIYILVNIELSKGILTIMNAGKYNHTIRSLSKSVLSRASSETLIDETPEYIEK
jgi:hypothetical protein